MEEELRAEQPLAERFPREIVLTPEVTREVTRALMSAAPRKWVTLGIVIVAALLSALEFTQGQTLLGALCIAYAAFAVGYFFWLRGSSARTSLKRLEETGKLGTRVRTAFSDEGLVTRDAGGGVTTITFDALRRVIETENAFVFLTKARQFVLIGKDAQTDDALRAFLKEKCGQGVKLNF